MLLLGELLMYRHMVLFYNVKIGTKRWRVDCNSKQDSVLLLSAIHLPGAIQVFTHSVITLCSVESQNPMSYR